MIFRLFILSVLFISIQLTETKAQSIIHKSFSPKKNIHTSVIPTENGDWLLVDLLGINRLNAAGDLIYNKRIVETSGSLDFYYHLGEGILDDAGFFYVAGATNEAELGGLSLKKIKPQTGDTIWTYYYGRHVGAYLAWNNHAFVPQVCFSVDKQFLYLNSFVLLDDGQLGSQLAKINLDGELIWLKTYAYASAMTLPYFRKMKVTQDAIWVGLDGLMKFDLDGTLLLYVEMADKEILDIEFIDDQCLLLGVDSDENGHSGYFMSLLDEQANVVWNKHYERKEHPGKSNHDAHGNSVKMKVYVDNDVLHWFIYYINQKSGEIRYLISDFQGNIDKAFEKRFSQFDWPIIPHYSPEQITLVGVKEFFIIPTEKIEESGFYPICLREEETALNPTPANAAMVASSDIRNNSITTSFPIELSIENEITVPVMPSADFVAEKIYCAGHVVEVDEESILPIGDSYWISNAWQNDTIFPTIEFPTLEQGGQFVLQHLKYVGGCPYSAAQELTVSNLAVSIEGDRAVCSEDSILMTVAVNQPVVSVNWEDDATGLERWVGSGGRYAVWVEDTLGCTKEAAVNIEALPLPEIALPDDLILCHEKMAVIEPIHWEGQLQWDDGHTAASHVVETSGWVFGKAFNDCGVATDSMRVIFDSCLVNVGVFTPTAFSPNDDGNNDTWNCFPNHSIVEHVKIYNRWGELIYDYQGEFPEWDGYFRQQLLPSDVYFFVLTYRNMLTQEQKTKTGDITLIR